MMNDFIGSSLIVYHLSLIIDCYVITVRQLGR